MHTLRLFPSVDFPLVPILCGECAGSRAHCPRCDGELELLVDEVLDVDTVLDAVAFEEHYAFRTDYFAQLQKREATRGNWPVRFPAADEREHIAQLQRDAMAGLVTQ